MRLSTGRIQWERKGKVGSRALRTSEPRSKGGRSPVLIRVDRRYVRAWCVVPSSKFCTFHCSGPARRLLSSAEAVQRVRELGLEQRLAAETL